MSAVAVLSNHGTVRFQQQSDKKTLVVFDLKNFKAFSTHAIHIHEYGDITEGCASLGGHFNPGKKNHGSLIAKERHVGDLINNFTTDVEGRFSLEFLDHSIHNVRDIFGRSVVIHYLEDDLGLGMYDNRPYSLLPDPLLVRLCKERGYAGVKSREERIRKLESESLITGNAGKRLVCGVIGISKI